MYSMRTCAMQVTVVHDGEIGSAWQATPVSATLGYYEAIILLLKFANSVVEGLKKNWAGPAYISLRKDLEVYARLA
jgi:hypothetical protein